MARLSGAISERSVYSPKVSRCACLPHTLDEPPSVSSSSHGICEFLWLTNKMANRTLQKRLMDALLLP